jgi:mono/diheme cytochrome c family protein
MKRIIGSLLVVLALSALSAIPAWGGGWAVITLDALPTSPQAGESLSVGFSVFQHGQTPLAGLDPTIVASHVESGERIQVQATDEGAVGHYAATLVLPSAGAWDWTIRAFGDVAQPMPRIIVEAAVAAAPQGSSAPAPPLLLGAATAGIALAGILLAYRRRYGLAGAAVALAVIVGAAGIASSQPGAPAAAEAAPVASRAGSDLFLAKGCVTCHVHQAIPESADLSVSVGPELTLYRNDSAFIARWLADPSAVRETKMPNLHLSPDEIAALVLFLNGPDDS